MRQNFVDLFPIHLDPLPANLYERFRARCNCLPLFFGNRRAIQRELGVKIHEGFEPDPGRLASPYGDLDFRPGWPPPCGHPNKQPSRFKSRNPSEKLMGLACREDLGLVDPLRLHKTAHKFTLRRCTLHRSQQRKESLSVFCPGKLFKRAAEREMLRRRLVRKPMRIGSQKGERMRHALFILGQVEGHAPDQIPKRVLGFQPALSSIFRAADSFKNQGVQFLPKACQLYRIQVFRPSHRRSGGRDLLKFERMGIGDSFMLQRVVGMAERRKIPQRKRPPKTFNRRHCGLDISSRQMQQQGS